jgi:hypothetical protein
MAGCALEDLEIRLLRQLGPAQQGEHPRAVEAGLEVVRNLGQTGIRLIQGLQVRKKRLPCGHARSTPC